MKICIVGTSHAFQMLKAVRALPEYVPTVEIDGFVLRERHFAKLALDSAGIFSIDQIAATLDPKTLRRVSRLLRKHNGKTKIDLNQYNEIIVVGYDVGQFAIKQTLANYDILGCQKRDRPNIMSKETYSVCCADLAKSVLPPDWWHNVKGNVHILPAPHPIETFLESSNSKIGVYGQLNANTDGLKRHWETYMSALGSALAENGFNLILQPDQFVTDGLLTKFEHSRQFELEAEGLSGAANYDYAHLGTCANINWFQICLNQMNGK